MHYTPLPLIQSFIQLQKKNLGHFSLAIMYRLPRHIKKCHTGDACIPYPMELSIPLWNTSYGSTDCMSSCLWRCYLQQRVLKGDRNTLKEPITLKRSAAGTSAFSTSIIEWESWPTNVTIRADIRVEASTFSQRPPHEVNKKKGERGWPSLFRKLRNLQELVLQGMNRGKRSQAPEDYEGFRVGDAPSFVVCYLLYPPRWFQFPSLSRHCGF